MSKPRECFVCGTLLATSERQRIEVRHGSDKLRHAETCQPCWWEVRGLRTVRVAKAGKTYDVKVRRLQVPLFRETARGVIKRGPTHV